MSLWGDFKSIVKDAGKEIGSAYVNKKKSELQQAKDKAINSINDVRKTPTHHVRLKDDEDVYSDTNRNEINEVKKTFYKENKMFIFGGVGIFFLLLLILILKK